MIQQRYPKNIDAERFMLGAIVHNKLVYNDVRDVLTPDCFYDDYHKLIYQTIKTVESRGESPDILTIIQELRKTQGDDVDMVKLWELTENSSTIGIYRQALHLKELAIRRSLIDLSIEMNSKALDESQDIADTINRVNEAITTAFQQSDGSVSTIKSVVKEVYDIIDKNKSNDTQLTGTPTGFDTFDLRSGGLQGSDLTIIAGETSQGKTSLALSIINNSAQAGAKIAMYSLEMTRHQLGSRLMAMNSGVSSSRIMFGRLEDYEFEKMDKSISKLINSSIYFDDRSTSNIDNILASIRTMKLKYNIDGVVIDYLQILNVNMKGANVEQQMGDVARRLKNIAKELDIWVVALSQLSRDMQNPVPNTNRLRSSGQIAEAADNIIFVYRPEMYNRKFPEPFENKETKGYALIKVDKGRNIGTMQFLAKFNAECTHYEFVHASDVPNIENDLPFIPATAY